MRKKEGYKSKEIQIKEHDLKILEQLAEASKRNLKNHLEYIIQKYLEDYNSYPI